MKRAPSPFLSTLPHSCRPLYKVACRLILPPPCLALVPGGSKAADALVKDHPSPHRLHSFMQLEGKNLAVVMPDAPLDVAVAQSVLGATSYNGQRCTAIKLIMVHESVAAEFVPKLVAAVGALRVGLPWEESVQITPLPEPKKPAYLAELIGDALEHGAEVTLPSTSPLIPPLASL